MSKPTAFPRTELDQEATPHHDESLYPPKSNNMKTVRNLFVALMIMCYFLVVHVNVWSAKQVYSLLFNTSNFDGFQSPILPAIEALLWTESTSPPESLSDKIQRLKGELRDLSLRYYIYEDPDMIQAHILTFLFKENKKHKGIRRKRYQQDAEVEIDILDALANHSLRTRDPNEADMFIFPLAVGANVIRAGLNSTQIAFRALQNSSYFKKYNGHRHVIVSLTQVAFDWPSIGRVLDLGMNRPLYMSLANVTIARDIDVFALTRLTLQGGAAHHDYGPSFLSKVPVTHSGFSLGLGAGRRVPFVPASYEKFQQASNFIFYHTREGQSLFNSTKFRHAPLTLNIPSSSIGLDIYVGKWLRLMNNSKFCLAIRGDTPHTHALMRAVKMGCIPVVISDFYPVYAPTLKSTLSMEDYCIFIPEDDFIANPEKELMALANLSEEFLRTKIEALQFAQQVALYDSPNSLFVPAFVKEADVAIKYHHPELCVYNMKEYPKIVEPYF
jgi:hypothetical protein